MLIIYGAFVTDVADDFTYRLHIDWQTICAASQKRVWQKSTKIYDLIYDIRQCLSTHQLESYIFAHVTLQYIGKTNRPVKNIFGC